jgi:protein SYS1
MMSGFRSQKWDPWLIISQIIAVQSLYYLSLGLWIFLSTLIVGRAPTLEYLFSFEVEF